MSGPKRCCVRCGADISHRAPQARYCSKPDNPECFSAGNRGAVRKTRQKKSAEPVGKPCGKGHHPEGGGEIGLCRRCGVYCTEARRRGATRPDRSYPKRRPRSLPKLSAASRKLTKDEIKWLNDVAPWFVSPAYARQAPSSTMAPAALGRRLVEHERWADEWRREIEKRRAAATISGAAVDREKCQGPDAPVRRSRSWGDPDRAWIEAPTGLVLWREREAARAKLGLDDVLELVDSGLGIDEIDGLMSAFPDNFAWRQSADLEEAA